MAEERSTEISVVGAGLSGLCAAAALAQATFDTTILAPDDRQQAGDPRTAALMPETMSLLRSIGALDACVDDTTPLRAMRIVDGDCETTFTADEIGADALAWNIPHAALSVALRDAASSAGAAFTPVHALGLRPQGDGARIALSNGGGVRSELVVAADGAQSRMRHAAGIAARRWNYGLTALVFMADSDHPHGEMSTERYLPDGSITLVPTGDRVSIVWIADHDSAMARKALSDAALGEEATAATQADLGALTPTGPRVAYPLGALNARRYGRSRVALIGEAAHRMPPLGSQGFNLTARDIIALRELAVSARDVGAAIGGQPLLAKYDRLRRGDVTSRVFAVDALTKMAKGGAGPLAQLRRAGLRGLAGPLAPLRKMLMREGMEPALARFGA